MISKQYLQRNGCMGLNEKVALMLLRLRMDANLELSGVVVVCFVEMWP